MRLKKLQQEADRLGVPWTYRMDEKGLLKLVEAARKQEPAVDGLHEKDGTYFYDGDPQPDCFGQFWAGIPGPDGEDCRNCGFADVCLDKFSQTALPAAEGSQGASADASEVGARFPDDGLPAEAIEAARAYRDKNHPPAKPKETEMASAKKAPPKKESSAKTLVKKKVAKKAPVKKAPVAEKVKTTPVEEVAEKAPSKKSPPALKKAPAKKAPVKKKVVKKKKAPLKKKAVKKAPVKKAAPSAKRAKAVVKKVGAKKSKTAKTVTGLAAKGMVPWGEHTFQSRWEKERARSPLTALVAPGMKLKVEWPKGSGDMYKVTCKKGYYLFSGQKYPTLYKVTECITGKGSQWSGPKFWKLKKHFGL